MAFYTGSSPYASTQIMDNEYLDLLTIRPVPAKPDDVLYTVEPQYNHRPDLLAYDIYGNENFGGCLLNATWTKFLIQCMILFLA